VQRTGEADFFAVITRREEDGYHVKDALNGIEFGRRVPTSV